MKREDKIKKHKARAYKRQKKHYEKYILKVRIAKDLGCPLHAIDRYGNCTGSWPDSQSPTGYFQKCGYYEICQSPCNGDC